MTFTLRPSTVKIAEKLTESYYRNPNIALLTVKTGGGKTYGAIHTFGQMFKKCVLLVFTTDKVAKSKQWQISVTDYNQVMHTQLTVFCNNYEKLTSQNFLNILADKLNEIPKQPIVLIIDEAHRIKLASNGQSSTRARKIIELARQPYITTVLGLSATAFSNSYIDVANYLVIAGYYNSKTAFLKKHIKHWDRFHAPDIKDSKGRITRDAFYDPDKIDWEMSQITNYVDTSIYMPKLYTYNEKFTLNVMQQMKYDQIWDDYEAGKYDIELENIVTDANGNDIDFLRCWGRARSDDEHLLADECSEAKDMFVLNVLKRQQKGEFDGIHPILIFYQYSCMYTHLKQLLMYIAPEYKIVTINGQVKIKPETLSKPTNEQSIYLVQYEAGGEGLDWQWSNISIFYEAPIKYEKFIQAKGRNLRNKSIMPKVYHFNLQMLNTYDAANWQNNAAKAKFTKIVKKKIQKNKAQLSK